MKQRGRPRKVEPPQSVLVDVPDALLDTALQFQRADIRTRTFLTDIHHSTGWLLRSASWDRATLPWQENRWDKDFIEHLHWSLARAEEAATERRMSAAALLHEGVSLVAARAVKPAQAPQTELEAAQLALAEAHRRVLELMQAVTGAN